MKSVKRHVFFDFDGVLCDSLAACLRVYQELRVQQFHALPSLDDADRMDLVFAGALKSSLHPWLGPDGTRGFFNAHSARMQALASTLAPFPGVENLLGNLPPGSASIVSSAYNDAIRAILAGPSGDLPLSISHLMGRDSGKDKTEKIEDVLAIEEAIPEEAVYVGDLHSDLLYCQSVPIDCLIVTYGYQTPVHLEQACVGALDLVHSVSDLEATLNRLMETP